MIKDTIRTGLVIDSADRRSDSRKGGPRYRVYFTDGTKADTMSDTPVGDGAWLPLAGTHEPVTVTFTPAGKIRHIETEPTISCSICGGKHFERACAENCAADHDTDPPGGFNLAERVTFLAAPV